MPGLYASLYTGLSGLQAQQAALNVVGHNIANVNTPGYTRQRADLSSRVSMVEGRVSFGTGVSLNSVQGLRDRFLDLQIYNETAKEAGATERYSGLDSISSSLGDTGEGGIAASIQGFFQGFQDLSAQPEDSAMRQNLVGKAQTMISSLQSRYALLDDQRNSADESVKSLVTEVNTLTEQIASLNKRITGEVTPGADNDARDQRKELTDKLASIVGITVMEGASGEYQIALDSGAAVLVGGNVAYQLKTAPGGTDGHVLVKSVTGSTETDVTAGIKNGKLGAKLDLRDNLLVGYQKQLDQVAAGVVSQVNLQHTQGFDLNGNAGQVFFGVSGATAANGLPSSGTVSTPPYKGMVQALVVNANIVADKRLIAASSVAAAGSTGNNANANKLANIQFTGGTLAAGVVLNESFSTAVGSLISDLGTETQKQKAQSQTEQNLLAALQTQRDRTSAVDLDEEAANMMTLQRGYQASARFLSVINQLTDQLINQFGQ